MAIAGYETEHGLYGYRELITRRAIDIAQPDLVWSGGFSECRRIAALAQAHNMTMAPHCFPRRCCWSRRCTSPRRSRT